MNRQLQDFHGGLHLETHKELSNHKISSIVCLPERIILPLQQNIGIAAVPVVKINEKVLKGQIIARANGYVSIPVHASTSGKIIDIGEYPVPHPLKKTAPCIVIEPDGEDCWFDIHPVSDYTTVDPHTLQNFIRDAGIVGLGGAGFPSHVKLCEGVENAVDTLIINGVECEPYISCDDRLMREKTDYIVSGTRMIQHAVQAKHCVIAIEEDMPEAYLALEKLIDKDIELVVVPQRYPAGGEKQLIKVLTGKEVPSDGFPIHIGIVMHNVGTAAAAFRAVTRGEPLISRYITVTGDLDDPKNLQVLLGTPISHCIKQCGYVKKNNETIILGGPMMGAHVEDMNMPVTKTTNCILVRHEFNQTEKMPCIQCGDCIDVCPINLLPQQLLRDSIAGNDQHLRENNLFNCIECGCCSYVCPSNIPLVQYYRQAKHNIALQEKKQTGANYSRKRFEEHNQRLKQKKFNDKKSSVNVTQQDKAAYIEEAVKKNRAKKSMNSKNSKK